MLTRTDDTEADTASQDGSAAVGNKIVTFFDMMCIKRGFFGLLTEFV